MVAGFIILGIVLLAFAVLMGFILHSFSYSSGSAIFDGQIGDEDGELFYVTTPDGEVRID